MRDLLQRKLRPAKGQGINDDLKKCAGKQLDCNVAEHIMRVLPDPGESL